ncbi:SDR family oxidoreductase [Spirillospora albida]|uniref:SDR family oxidoreductase n=1 Tax=Spirillospora albida TaxID=58123 RepID=UPI0004BFBC3A|nr:SDR family oxidoreductase [Spirillospora albida]
MRILVTGASGTLGSHVVRLLAAPHGPPGVEVHALSRAERPSADGVIWHRGDLATGEGIAGAAAGMDVIVHCASDARRPKGELSAARTLVEAARANGSPRLVYISIVGVDRIPFGYYQAKYAVERYIENGGLPYAVLRTTQFHDFPAMILEALAKVPGVLPVPAGLRVQPIDAGEVAARLVELALAPGAAGRAEDMGGPETFTFAELARSYLAATGRRRVLLPLRIPGRAMRGFRAGHNLAPGHVAGERTWREFLGRRK